MSYYYKYQFVSPEPIFGVVKEELRTYFEAGAVDDLMFSVWMDRALKKLGRATNKILETVLCQEDFESKLPPDFQAVREAWLCTEITPWVQRPNAKYDQVFCRVTPVYDECDPCSGCVPEVLRVTYKETESGPYPEMTIRRVYLLKPGNIETKANHELPLINLNASGPDSYDIRGNKFVTNLRKGMVHLIYYAIERDGEDYQMIPDNYWIQEYVKRFIKYKIFEQLWNQTTDETYNQIKQKMDYYKSSYEEGWIMAEIEIKKRTPTEVQRDINRNAHRLDPYKIDTQDHGGRLDYGRGSRGIIN